MLSVTYRTLEIDECKKINEMNPSQYIKREWREVDGKRQLVGINYEDPDWPNGYEHHFKSLQETIINAGYAVGAFDESHKLIGFATINRDFFGDSYNYVLLDQLFVTLEHRNKGIGKKLFM